MEALLEAEERIKTLESAVRWALQQVTDLRYFREIQDELRARAFPPKFESVEVKRWKCVKCGKLWKSDVLQCHSVCGGQVIVPLLGHYQRPSVAKVNHREELIARSETTRSAIVEYPDFILGAKYFREWESILQQDAPLIEGVEK